jgi:hypothetical protein
MSGAQHRTYRSVRCTHTSVSLPAEVRARVPSLPLLLACIRSPLSLIVARRSSGGTKDRTDQLASRAGHSQPHAPQLRQAWSHPPGVLSDAYVFDVVKCYIYIYICVCVFVHFVFLYFFVPLCTGVSSSSSLFFVFLVCVCVCVCFFVFVVKHSLDRFSRSLLSRLCVIATFQLISVPI